MRGIKPKQAQIEQWALEFQEAYGEVVGEKASGRYSKEEAAFINEWHNKGISPKKLSVVIGRPADEVAYKIRTDSACCLDCNVPDPEKNGEKWCHFGPRGRRGLEKRKRKEGPGSHYTKDEKALIGSMFEQGKSFKYILSVVKKTRPATTKKSLKSFMRRNGWTKRNKSKRVNVDGKGRQFKDGNDRIELIENGSGRKRYVVTRETFKKVLNFIEIELAA